MKSNELIHIRDESHLTRLLFQLAKNWGPGNYKINKIALNNIIRIMMFVSQNRKRVDFAKKTNQKEQSQVADKKVSFAIIGAGSRGLNSYGKYIREHLDEAEVVAVAEPREFQRNEAVRRFNIPSLSFGRKKSCV